MNKLLFFTAGLLIANSAFPQGTNTHATAGDWEEINFEFNQSVIADGFPGLLRLAELLKQNPAYKVSLVGNTDQVGGTRANDALSVRRATAVGRFLEHYGASASQI